MPRSGEDPSYSDPRRSALSASRLSDGLRRDQMIPVEAKVSIVSYTLQARMGFVSAVSSGTNKPATWLRHLPGETQ